MRPAPTTPGAKRSAAYDAESSMKAVCPESATGSSADATTPKMQGQASPTPWPAPPPQHKGWHSPATSRQPPAASGPSISELMNMLHIMLGGPETRPRGGPADGGQLSTRINQQDQRLQKFEHVTHSRFQENEQRLAQQETTAGADLEHEALERRSEQPRASSRTGEDFVIILGDIGRDRPADEVEKVARRFLATLPSAARLGNQAAQGGGAQPTSSSGSEVGGSRCLPFCAPWKLTSVAHLRFGTDGFGRVILRELRDKCQKGMYKIGGRENKLYATQQRTREKRLRNKKLVSMAEVIQKYLQDSDRDKSAEPWARVGSRSKASIFGNIRRATLER